MKEVFLYNGVRIPKIGYGTYKLTLENGYQTILEAIEVGYRHLDTAALYQNEEEVGKAIRESGIAREEFFITSKLDRDHLGYENALKEFEESCQKLGTSYLDLYLIHWPRPSFGSPDFEKWRELDKETWRAFVKLYKEGRVRAIGVSNFLPHHLENLSEFEIQPMVNQLELHPGYDQKEAVTYCKAHNIALEAWSPFARGRLNDHPLLKKIAASHSISVPEVCLAFELEKGWIVLPKASSKERMKTNLEAEKIRLTKEEILLLENMEEAGWSGEHPDKERIRF